MRICPSWGSQSGKYRGGGCHYRRQRLPLSSFKSTRWISAPMCPALPLLDSRAYLLRAWTGKLAQAAISDVRFCIRRLLELNRHVWPALPGQVAKQTAPYCSSVSRGQSFHVELKNVQGQVFRRWNSSSSPILESLELSLTDGDV